jgi:hypothetical protein
MVLAPDTGFITVPPGPIATEAGPARALAAAQAWELARRDSWSPRARFAYVVLRALRNKEARPWPGFFFLNDAQIANAGGVRSARCLFVMKARMPPMTVMSIHRGLGRRIGGRLNAEGATNSAKDAADDTADNNAKGSCRLIADSCAMRNAVGDALSLRRKWASK